MKDKSRLIIWALSWITVTINYVIFAKPFANDKITLLLYVVPSGLALIGILKTTKVIQNEK